MIVCTLHVQAMRASGCKFHCGQGRSSMESVGWCLDHTWNRTQCIVNSHQNYKKSKDKCCLLLQKDTPPAGVETIGDVKVHTKPKKSKQNGEESGRYTRMKEEQHEDEGMSNPMYDSPEVKKSISSCQCFFLLGYLTILFNRPPNLTPRPVGGA